MRTGHTAMGEPAERESLFAEPAQQIYSDISQPVSELTYFPCVSVTLNVCIFIYIAWVKIPSELFVMISYFLCTRIAYIDASERPSTLFLQKILI